MAFIPFRRKILGAFLALLSAVLALSLGVISLRLTRQIEQQVRDELGVTRGVFEALLESRRRQLAAAVGLLSEDFAFKQSLGTKDSDTIASNALSLQQRVGADLVWVSDDEGRLYADTSKLMKPGASILHFSAFAAALGQGEGPGAGGPSLEMIGGGAYQLEAVPVTAAGEVLGVLVAGFRVDDAIAAELKRKTLSDVSFEAGGRIIASTLDPRRRGVLEAGRSAVPEGGSGLIGPKGARELVLRIPLNREFAAYVERSWDEAVKPLRRLQRILIVIGVFGIALCFGAGVLIANGVTASMAKLAAATDRLLEGDYTVQVDIRQRDEIGRLGDAFNRMVTGLQEKEKIRSVLRKAVSKEIADELLKRGRINLGGETRPVTVLFADVRGFTTISENLSPQELVAQLNAYFTRMSRAIEAQRGVIDKYVGDAVMALFGAPLGSVEDADRAQRAALAMVQALDDLNGERAARGLPPWANGIGLNTGPAVAGTLGSENRWSYTVIGDSVNLASRLEGLTKHYGVRILVSQDTKEASGARFLYRPLDLVRVKGKQKPAEVYELLGEGLEPPAWLGSFEAGLKAYRAKDFGAAQARFEAVLREAPDDHPSRAYLQRIQPLLAGVPADWDPAHTMVEK